jgi:hypothetical protein
MKGGHNSWLIIADVCLRPRRSLAVARELVKGKGFPQLLSRPLCGRVGGHTDWPPKPKRAFRGRPTSRATGTILGTVTDSTGAVLPNVKVTVTNTATNVPFRTITSSSGDYLAPALNPGTYSVSAEAKGFQKSVTTGSNLAVDQKVRIVHRGHRVAESQKSLRPVLDGFDPA